MTTATLRVCLCAVLGTAASLLAFPSPALADGGPILSDPQLWASLKEGQQTAVVTLEGGDAAHIDLFVTMLDDTGQSHEIVYFVPLGVEAEGFQVTEQTSLDFDQQLTKRLDERLMHSARDRNNTRLYLLGVTSVISGGWLLPLSIPLALTGCAGSPGPEATFQTESSNVSIFGLDQETDLDDLINTTGLDPSVKETLSRLRGQRIAVITLQTSPSSSVEPGPGPFGVAGQPGLHLSWSTTLVRQSAIATYSYPLGTGSAWSHPIELTRVYVVAPPGLDFTVRYPKLGDDRSGFDLAFIFGRDTSRIVSHYGDPAYAADEANDRSGRVWRATYSQSNSAEDIVITAGASGGPVQAIRRWVAGRGDFPLVLAGVLLAGTLWVIAWRYVMPRVIGIRYRWGEPAVWRDSLSCLGINAGIVLAVVLLEVALFAGRAGGFGYLLAIPLVLFVVLPAAFGVPALQLYLRRRWWHTSWPGTGASWMRVFGAYVLVALVSNVAYLVIGYGLGTLAGVV